MASYWAGCLVSEPDRYQYPILEAPFQSVLSPLNYLPSFRQPENCCLA